MSLDPRIKERVDEFLAGLERSPLAGEVLGVLVSGSAARQEEVWAGEELLSDIDLMVLTRRTSPRLIAAIDRLIGEYRHLGIDGGQVPLGPLRTYLTLSFFEARAGGVAVYGGLDPQRLIPPTDPARLPLWEAVRVLGNRLVEHVKYDAGQLSAARVVGKSYEALAEAYLVAERRYRPSYTERLAEIERAAPDAPPRVVAGMVAVLHHRLGGAPVKPDVREARADLIDGLGRVAAQLSTVDGDARAQLARLAGRERHWRHRLYWSALMLRQGRFSPTDLRYDPVLRLWQRALAAITIPCPPEHRDQLLRDARSCPQILVRRPAP